MLQTQTRPAARDAAEGYKFSAKDRCDRCGAQAYTRATHGQSDLLFCGHHTRAHTPALIAAGFVVDDQTHRIADDAKPNTTD